MDENINVKKRPSFLKRIVLGCYPFILGAVISIILLFLIGTIAFLYLYKNNNRLETLKNYIIK